MIYHLIYCALVTALSFKCYVDRIYGHALTNRFILRKDFSGDRKIGHLCWMIPVQKQENSCIPVEESWGMRTKKTFHMVKW